MTTWHPLDDLTSDLTAFNSFSELVNTHPTYRPTILPRDARHVDLADAYDAFQAARGDKRRAWRGTGPAAGGAACKASPFGHLAIRFAGVPAGSGLYSEWLRVIHAINRAAPDTIGSPLDSWHQSDGAWVEDYPDFQVVLRYTKWGHSGNSGTILAKTTRASEQLAAAVAAL